MTPSGRSPQLSDSNPEQSIPNWLRDEYPFQSRFLDFDGRRYHYVDEGSGPVLLFVHGNPTWSFAWRNLIKAFSPHYRCLAVDHLGMGLSDKPLDAPYTLNSHVTNLTRFVDELNLRDVTLIGHDWGGCIGMGAAGRAPERYSRFVMMNTAAFRSRRIPLRIAVCRIPVLGGIGVRGLNLFSRAALSMAIAPSTTLSPDVRAGYLFPYDSWNHRIAVHRFVQDIPLNAGHPSYATLVEVEQGLTQFRDHPWLLMWGEQDWCFTTAFLDEWEQRFPAADVLRLPQASHYLFEDAPQLLVDRLQAFLLK